MKDYIIIIALLLAAPSAAVGRAQPVDPHIGAGTGRKAVLQGPWARSCRFFSSIPSRPSPSPRVHHCCCSGPGCPGLSGCFLALLAFIVRVTRSMINPLPSIYHVRFILIATRIVAPKTKKNIM